MPDAFDDGAGLAADRLSLRQWASLSVLLAGVFVATLDNFIVLVAIPDIRASLGASSAEAELVVAAYALTFAVGLITGGRLGDRHGRRRMFMIGGGAFTLASCLCGLATSPEALIGSRIAQGLSASILMPQVFAIIRVTFQDARQRGRALACMSIMIGLASVLGQILGGLIIAADLWGLSWRPIFLINLPVGAIMLLAAPRVLQESRAPGVARLDLAGSVLGAAGLGLLLYPLAEGREAGWPGWSIAMLAAAAILLLAFGLHQHARTVSGRSPLVDTTLFRERSFTVGLFLVLLFYATLSPFFLCLTYMLQLGFGRSPFDAAIAFSPLALAFASASFLSGRMRRRDPRGILLAGACLTSAGGLLAYGACAALPGFTPGYLLPALVITGAGQGLFMAPVINVVLGGIREDHAGAAAGVLTTMQRIGNALGVALLQIPFAATLAGRLAGGADTQAAYVAAFGTVALCVAMMAAAVIGLLLMLRPPARPAGGR
ncbi:MAG TPA: MFS transporter [Roseomonas sp.]|jgi:EmrB/QacA subfamily drug resistance transporter